ncbi:DUF5684 domain-containing protein [Halosimplex aquaticum]|uniref:DUF5684 domain-containing protein n=1 Tax=Halosimplex aquaticum TaxID=3026162 RepID=A0ABD5Y4R1_9EURY|nr:DUF5684 domain-containing protein [Halosimplex aquaticum]
MAGNLFGSGLVATALQTSTGAGDALAGVLLLFMGISLVLSIISIAGMWKTFTKAGQPGWAAIIPIYNYYVLVCEIADRDMVWFLLSIFIPFAVIIPMIDVAKAFGKGAGYGLGLFFLGFIFFPLLGFGDARYRGASGI